MERKINILLIGESKVGKTRFAHVLHHKSYEEYSSPTLGVEFMHSSQYINGNKIEFQTWEINIKKIDLIHTIKTQFDCVLLCTSCQVKRTIPNLLQIKDFLFENICPKAKFIMMCCKLDALACLAPLEFNYFIKELHDKTLYLDIPVLISSAKTNFYIKDSVQMIFDVIINNIPIKTSIDEIIKKFENKEKIPSYKLDK